MHVSRIEAGRANVSLPTLVAIASAFGVEVHALFAARVSADLAASREEGLGDASPTEPFKILHRPPRAGTRAVPLYDLEAAAGGFGAGRAVEAKAWVVPRGAVTIRPGMFVAVVVGKSMEPRIPSGAYCLFIAPVRGIPTGRIVLAEHRSVADPETGGSYSVKKLAVESVGTGRKARRRLRLLSENPAFAPLEIADPDAVHIVAELVSVLGPPPRVRRP